MTITWLQFLVCTTLIGISGYQLSRFGDAIAERTGLGRTLVGVFMVATVTSLPELMTGISAVAIVDAPNIAVGDVLGSCIFNLLLLLLLEAGHPRASIYTLAAQSHILSAGLGVILLGIIALSILAGDQMPAIGHVGLYTPVILGGYLLAMHIVTRYELQEAKSRPAPATLRYPHISLRRAVAGYSAAAVVVIAAGTWLPFIGTDIAHQMGWNNSFVGTLLVAFSTSLPEVAVVVSALRIGALDLAIGNLLGSNLFDTAILSIDDLVYTKGPLFSAISHTHVGTAISAIVMTGVVITALYYRPAERRFRLFGWAGLLLLIIFVTNTYALFLYGQ